MVQGSGSKSLAPSPTVAPVSSLAINRRETRTHTLVVSRKLRRRTHVI